MDGPLRRKLRRMAHSIMQVSLHYRGLRFRTICVNVYQRHCLMEKGRQRRFNFLVLLNENETRKNEKKHDCIGIDTPTEIYFSSRCETFHLIDYNFSIK